jgi:FtsH-binding integral membrane protein
MYIWMAGGLALSGVVAGYIHARETLSEALGGSVFVLAGLVVAELLLVIFLSGRIHRMPPPEALVGYVGYALLTGVTFAAIFSVHTGANIGIAFLMTAAMFAVAGVYAVTTAGNLSGWRHYLFMAGAGFAIAVIVNLSLDSTAGDWIVSLVAIAIFVVLTAYDTRRVVELSNGAVSRERDPSGVRGSDLGVVGALRVYLDLVNIFFLLLRLVGGRE